MIEIREGAISGADPSIDGKLNRLHMLGKNVRNQ
jgi:hypothetical protein